MKLKKKRFWEQDFHTHLASEIGKPFEWGVRDCTLFAAGCVQSMVAEKIPLPEPNYSTGMEALAFYRRLGYSTQDWVLNNFETMAVEHGYWQKGDLIFYQIGPFIGCHVTMDHRLISCSEDAGVAFGNLKELPPDGTYWRIL